MAIAKGNIRVYEASDAGTGDPARTFWQFFVGAQPVTTNNLLMAETARLAIQTESAVSVTYDSAAGNTISQIRMEFAYICEAQQIRECIPGSHEPGPQKTVCQTRRYSDCTQSQPNNLAQKPTG